VTPKAVAEMQRVRRVHTHNPTHTSTEDVIAVSGIVDLQVRGLMV
jgi:hypothetical protein